MNEDLPQEIILAKRLQREILDIRRGESDALFELRAKFEELQKDTILRQCFTARIHEIDLALGALKAMIDQLEK